MQFLLVPRRAVALAAAVLLHLLLLHLAGFDPTFGWRTRDFQSEMPAIINVTLIEQAGQASRQSSQLFQRAQAVQLDTESKKEAERSLSDATQTFPDAAGIELPASLALKFDLAHVRGTEVRHGQSWLTWVESDGAYTATHRWEIDGDEGLSTSSGVVSPRLTPAEFDVRGPGASSSLSPGAQDTVSMIWALAQLLRTQIDVASDLKDASGTFQFGAASEYISVTWHVRQVDDLMLPAGNFQAVLVHATSELSGAPNWDIWFAPKLQFMPVRIKHTDAKGNISDAVLSVLPQGLDR